MKRREIDVEIQLIAVLFTNVSSRRWFSGRQHETGSPIALYCFSEWRTEALRNNSCTFDLCRVLSPRESATGTAYFLHGLETTLIQFRDGVEGKYQRDAACVRLRIYFNTYTYIHIHRSVSIYTDVSADTFQITFINDFTEGVKLILLIKDNLGRYSRQLQDGIFSYRDI